MSRPEFERKADKDAAESLVPPDKMEDFIRRTRPLFSKKKIVNFANRIGVHPGLIVGQLQHREDVPEVPFSHFRDLLVKVRSIVTDAALTDGWGHRPPANL